MKKNFFVLFKIAITFLLLINGVLIKAQVTIGDNTPPAKFSLLELVSGDNKGLRLPQITNTAQRDAIFTNAAGFDTNPNAIGLQIYNMQTKRVEVWNGTNWNTMWGENAANGLTLTNDTIVLGGPLDKPTTVDLNSNNLLFTRSSGNVGIGTTSPQSMLHLKDEVNDPLIIDDLKFTSELPNPVDAANTAYYNLQISDKGVVRKAPNVNHISETYIYTLRDDITVPVGSSGPNGAQWGLQGATLKWVKNEVPYDYITLPEDGAYVFSFRLYGTTDNNTSNGILATSYYISALVGSDQATVAYDVVEMIVPVPNHGTTAAYNKATYTVFLTVAGKAETKIYFKIAEVAGRTLTWKLLGKQTAGSEVAANRTSMIFWKI